MEIRSRTPAEISRPFKEFSVDPEVEDRQSESEETDGLEEGSMSDSEEETDISEKEASRDFEEEKRYLEAQHDFLA